MCGISMVIDRHGNAPRTWSALGRMHAMLAHRGPDGEGALFVDQALRTRVCPPPMPGVGGPDGPRVAIGFRRLAIQDRTPAGRQPIASASGRHWIVHNGEIYNHGALRATLEGLGHRFRGASDSEVALAAYLQWGTECFERFNGMWAMLLLDLDRGILVGSRDRLGIKPLYYAGDDDWSLWASEPQAVACAAAMQPAIDEARFVQFLRGHPSSQPIETFFRNVRAVPAGSVFEIDLRAPTVPPAFRRFWTLGCSSGTPTPVMSFEGAARGLADLLDDAVRLRLQAAVPVGCLLSGGIDSSLIAVTAAGVLAPEPLSAFSIVYDDPGMSEAPYILAVAGAAGLSSHRYVLSPDVAWSSVDDVIRRQGEPLLGQELIAQYHAFRFGRDLGAVVVLDGQGADELLAGLPSYATWFLLQLLVSLRWAALRGEAGAAGRLLGRNGWAIVGKQLVGLGRRALMARCRVPRYRWISGDVRAAEASDLPAERCADPSLLNRHLFRLVRRTNLPTVLMYQDRSSMAHGVESRVPFLDHRIVELCFQLPAEYKVRFGERKRVLRRVARERLPDIVLRRTDKRMFVSRADWLPLRDRRDTLADMVRGPVGQMPGVRPVAARRFVDAYLAGRHEDARAVWRLYTASRWLAAFHNR